MSDITIYHNPKCGTSRNTLAMIRNSGAEPLVIEYLKTPPERLRRFPLLSNGGAIREGGHRRCCGAALARRLLAQGAPVSKGACTNGDVFE